jgi:CHAT domain-containing protein
LKLGEALGLKSVIANSLHSIGIVHRSQGNYAQALDYYQKGLTLSEALGDKATIAITLNNFGEVHQSQGNYALALDYHRKSLKLSESAGDKYGVSLTLANLGFVHQSQGDYEQALDYYRKSLALKESLGDKNGTALMLANIGGIYHRQGHAAQALDSAARASALARQIGSLDILWDSQLTAAKAYVSLGQPVPARRALTDSIETIETMRTQVAGAEQDSQRFFENKLSPYLAMTELLIRQNNVGEALTYAERAKARVLLDVLRGGRASVTKAMTAEEQEQERQLTGRLVSLNSQIQRESLRAQPEQSRLANLKAQLHTARLDYEALQNRLYAAHPELKVKRGESTPLKLDEAAGLLPDAQSALLEYVLTEEKTYLFVLTRSGDGRQAKAVARVFPLNISAKELVARAANFRRQLAGRDLLYRKTAVELYELLLGPARALLKGKRMLTIVPDGMLWEMPFQALQPTPGRHLIEESAVSYAPSLTVLREMNKARGTARPGGAHEPMSLLAVGNPLLGTQAVERLKARLMEGELLPLPEAEAQVKELQHLYGAAHSRVYVGRDAREERIKADAGKYRILHLATHGIFDDAAPMYSHVILANEEGDAREDGVLEAWEMMNLDLHAELVVLSACETARGRVGAGEGMIGLAWALFVAGSPSTVVSQWKVDAASTNTLMLEFHRSLRARNSRARALQQATLKTLQDRRYRHPFYWAPFVLIGDAN